jgi:methyl coenzyme M reductase subunit C
VFVAGETEVDKPFLVEQSRRLLQELNSPPVVLDQVVVGSEDSGDCCLLTRVVRNFDLASVQVISIDTWNCSLVAL